MSTQNALQQVSELQEKLRSLEDSKSGEISDLALALEQAEELQAETEQQVSFDIWSELSNN